MFRDASQRFAAVVCLIVAGWATDSIHAGGLLADQPKVPSRTSFAGTWNGTYQNSRGDGGQAVYEFVEDGAGRLTGKVSWDGTTMALAGERLGRDALRLQGKTAESAYRYVGEFDGGELVVHYGVRAEKSGERYFGVSRLTRKKD